MESVNKFRQPGHNTETPGNGKRDTRYGKQQRETALHHLYIGSANTGPAPSMCRKVTDIQGNNSPTWWLSWQMHQRVSAGHWQIRRPSLSACKPANPTIKNIQAGLCAPGSRSGVICSRIRSLYRAMGGSESKREKVATLCRRGDHLVILKPGRAKRRLRAFAGVQTARSPRPKAGTSCLQRFREDVKARIAVSRPEGFCLRHPASGLSPGDKLGTQGVIQRLIDARPHTVGRFAGQFPGAGGNRPRPKRCQRTESAPAR